MWGNVNGAGPDEPAPSEWPLDRLDRGEDRHRKGDFWGPHTSISTRKALMNKLCGPRPRHHLDRWVWHYRTSGLRINGISPKPSSLTNSNSDSVRMWMPNSVLMLQITLDMNIKSLLEALCYSELKCPQSTAFPDKLPSGMLLRPPSFSPDLQEDHQRLDPLSLTPPPHPPEVQTAVTGHPTSQRCTFRPGLCLYFWKYSFPIHTSTWTSESIANPSLRSQRPSSSRHLKVPAWTQPTSLLIPIPPPISQSILQEVPWALPSGFTICLTTLSTQVQITIISHYWNEIFSALSLLQWIPSAVTFQLRPWPLYTLRACEEFWKRAVRSIWFTDIDYWSLAHLFLPFTESWQKLLR